MKTLRGWLFFGLFFLPMLVWAQVATYDGATGILSLPAVRVGSATYVGVTLQNIGNFTFRLTGATEQVPPGPADITYDGATGIVFIPVVQVGDQTYTNVTLKNVGNLDFALQSATPGGAGVLDFGPPTDADGEPDDGGDVGGDTSTAAVASITLTPGAVSVDVGANASFIAVARDSGGNVVGVQNFTWESSNPTLASVVDGLATGLAAGSTTIIARVGNVASNGVALSVQAAAPPSGPRPVCGPNAGSWTSLAAAVANVRVWFDSTRLADQLQAQQVVAEMDNNIWPTLIITLGFRAPLADAALACNGGDGRLDIYIVANLSERGRTTPANPTGNASEVFIAIKDGLSGDELKYTLAHEFMFAVEWSYTMAAAQTSYGWMRNAMANWAVEAVYPGNPVLLADASCHMNSNFLSIDVQAAGACTGNASRSRDHGAYLLYQYIGRTMGNTKVRDLLAATTTLTSALTAIDTLVPGGLRTVWPRFAKTLWNQPPITDAGRPAFRNWDGNSTEPVLAPDHPVPVDANRGALAEASTAMSKTVANVSTRYYRFTFSDAETHTLMFHNTFYPLYKSGKKVSVQALWRVGGAWVEENWTHKEWIGFCRDAKAQRLVELVVIVASAEVGPVTQVDAAIAPTFKRNNIGCWGYGGSAQRTDQFASWSAGSIVLNSTPLYSLQLNPGGTGLQFNDAIRLRVPIAAPLFRSAGWSLAEGYSENGCSYALTASGTGQSILLGGNAFGSIVINNFAESLPATLRLEQFTLLGTVPGAYTVDAGSTLVGLKGSVSGPQPDCGTIYESAPGVFVLTNDTEGSGPVVRLDGHLAGSFVEGALGDGATFVWDLAPLREP